jgi:hypothetical protein
MITLEHIKGIMMQESNKICAISAMSFQCILNNANNYYSMVEQFASSLYEINTTRTNDNENKIDICTIVLLEYYQYLKIFEKANTAKLP